MGQPDGAVFLPGTMYPGHDTRILGVVLGIAITAAACRLYPRIPGRAPTKAVFSLTAGAVVAVVVRSQNLSWTFDSNLAFQRWLFGCGAVVVAAALMAAARVVRANVPSGN